MNLEQSYELQQFLLILRSEALKLHGEVQEAQLKLMEHVNKESETYSNLAGIASTLFFYFALDAMAASWSLGELFDVAIKNLSPQLHGYIEQLSPSVSQFLFIKKATTTAPSGFLQKAAYSLDVFGLFHSAEKTRVAVEMHASVVTVINYLKKLTGFVLAGMVGNEVKNISKPMILAKIESQYSSSMEFVSAFCSQDFDEKTRFARAYVILKLQQHLSGQHLEYAALIKTGSKRHYECFKDALLSISEFIDEQLRTIDAAHKWMPRSDYLEFLETHYNYFSLTPQLPATYCCPLTLELMVDPVVLYENKRAYHFERTAIEQWIFSKATNPLTKNLAYLSDLEPDVALRCKIAAFREFYSVKQSFSDGAASSSSVPTDEGVSIPSWALMSIS